ncbi:MAG TPA: two-component system sensor histidine kinase CreC [bacterium]|nr:two-component system sensor histidine kinase CreC [bacterium]
MKLRTRIILSFTVLVGIGFYFLVRHILAELRPRYLEAVEEVLVDEANLLAAFLESEMKSATIPVEGLARAFAELKDRPIRAQIYKMTKTKVDERVYVTDDKGTVLFDSEGLDQGKNFLQWRDVYLTLRGEYGARTSRDSPNNPASSVLHVAAPIRYQGQIVGVLTLRKPTASINFFLGTARSSIALAGGIAALSVILLGALVSAWVTRPLQKLTGYARAVGEGRPALYPKLGSSEIAEMGLAYEGMREALEGKKYVEEYIQTLTHELKSPIAAIQGAAEILQAAPEGPERQKFVANIGVESQRMQRVVDRLLELSALETRRDLLRRETLALANLIEESLDRFDARLQAKGIAVQARLEPVELSGERFLLEAAIENLLLNAIDFAPRGSSLEISLSESPQQALLTIADRGPGIPDYALGRIFERFYSLPRPETGKKSSGLGLSLVREVARLHGGKIELQNRKEGGVVARLTLSKVSNENS